MKMMGKLLVVLAVVAGILTIVSFFKPSVLGSFNIGRPQSFTFALIVISVLICSWFIFSWAIIRRYWLKTDYSSAELKLAENNRYATPRKRIRFQDDLSEIAGVTVYPIGVGAWLGLTSFLLWLISSFEVAQANKVIWYPVVLCGTIAWGIFFSLLIKYVIVSFMPKIYPDMFEM
jgi:hypothetical protein